MATPLYELSVPTFLQAVKSVATILGSFAVALDKSITSLRSFVFERLCRVIVPAA